MPKISTDSIPNFENLTAEEKLSALLNLDVPEAVDLSGYVKKEVFDKKAHEAAEYNRQLKEKMSDDEKKKAEEDAARAKLQADYDELLKKTQLEGFTNQYLSMGYSKEDAVAMATAHFENDSAKMFEIMTKHSAAMETQIRDKLLKETPKPKGAGGAPSDKEKTPDIVLAENIGKAAADSAKTANDILSKYIGG